MFNEVEFLLHQELRETSLYNSIIEAIALGNTKINEISTQTLINNTSKTSVYLKNLIELGIVERELSIDAGNKEIANNNRGIYQLTDQFFRFWYTFIFTNYSSLEDGDVDGIYQYVIADNLDRYASITYEKVCQQYLTRLQLKNKLPFRYEKIGRWFGKTTVRSKNNNTEIKVNEDKQLGPFFLNVNDLMDRYSDNKSKLQEKFNDLFKDKIIMYLFEDAAKQKKDFIFSGIENPRIYSEICKEYDEKGLKIFGEDFTNKVKEFEAKAKSSGDDL